MVEIKGILLIRGMGHSEQDAMLKNVVNKISDWMSRTIHDLRDSPVLTLDLKKLGKDGRLKRGISPCSLAVNMPNSSGTS